MVKKLLLENIVMWLNNIMKAENIEKFTNLLQDEVITYVEDNKKYVITIEELLESEVK